jgi:hypothetical protein
VGRNEPIRNSISRECLLYMRSYWLVLAHRAFRYIGREVKLVSRVDFGGVGRGLVEHVNLVLMSREATSSDLRAYEEA